MAQACPYEIRELFEGLAARTCCETATTADIREMYVLIDRNYEFGKRGLIDERTQSDRDFHSRIVLTSRNELLANLTDNCRALGMAVRNLRDLDVVYAEHRSIVRAIEDRRPQKAERAARDHICAAREAIQESIRQGTFRSQWGSRKRRIPPAAINKFIQLSSSKLPSPKMSPELAHGFRLTQCES